MLDTCCNTERISVVYRISDAALMIASVVLHAILRLIWVPSGYSGIS
jgi:hypothetical protein